MDAPSAQLQLDLRHAIQEALATRRPLLHRLNAGHSWLLQIPRPETAVRRGARFYYNVLIDPCFSPTASGRPDGDFASVTCIAELEEVARELEILASGLRLGRGRTSNAVVEEASGKLETLLDAVVISQDLNEPQNLLSIHPDVPLLALGELHSKATKLDHFRTVAETPYFGLQGDRDWRSTSVPPLPDWIGVGMLPHDDDGDDADCTLVIMFNNRHQEHISELANTACRPKARARRHAAIEPDEAEKDGEAIILASHALEASSTRPLVFANPALRCLAYIHLSRLAQNEPASYDVEEHPGPNLDAIHSLNAKYWIQAAEGVEPAQLEGDDGLRPWLWQLMKKVLGGHGEAKKVNKRRRLSNGGHEQTPGCSASIGFIELRAGESRVLL